MDSQNFDIEDCLEIVTGRNNTYSKFVASEKDKNVLNSIAKQIDKGTALTDKQYELVAQLLAAEFYVNQFRNHGVNELDYIKSLERTRNGIREINRSKYVDIVDTLPDQPSQLANRSFFSRGTRQPVSTQPNEKWIRVGFPFNKLLATIIDDLGKIALKYVHDRDSRDHYFRLDEHIAYGIVTALSDKGFDIVPELVELSKTVGVMHKNKLDYLPTVSDGILSNFHPVAERHLVKKLGVPSNKTALLYKDRSILYNIEHIDSTLLEQSTEQVTDLTSQVAQRESTQILIKPSSTPLPDVIQTISELDRFPLLVIIPADSALDALKNFHKETAEYISATEAAVMFRLDNTANSKFNSYVKDNGLNNPVDENTKVVYICKDKLPKPLLKANWYPEAVIHAGSHRVQSKIDLWLLDCDLVIHYDEVALTRVSQHLLGSVSTQVANKRKIQKI